MPEEIINRVAGSGIISLDLGDFLPASEIVELDLKPWLFREMILKEKDFRQHIKDHPWEQYEGKLLAVFCSVETIIPSWAFMIIASKAAPFAEKIYFGNKASALEAAMRENIHSRLDPAAFTGQRVVVKGCGDVDVPPSVFMEVSTLLVPHVQALMFGEPCSTVPVFKKPKEKK